MTASDCFVSVVAPLRNDADIVEQFLAELIGVLRNSYTNYEIVLVVDGSDDDTFARALKVLEREGGIRLLRLSRNFGEQIAITAGLEAVIGDYIVVIRPDFDPPALIPAIVAQARRGEGIVTGLRKGPRRGEGLLTRIGATIFFWLCNRFLNLKIPENSTTFQVMSRQSVNALIQMKDRLRHIRSMVTYLAFVDSEFEYELISRREKPRGRGFFEALDLAISVIVANSSRPLRIVSWLGLLISVLFIVGGLGAYLWGSNLPAGWVTFSVQTSCLFFFVFLILVVLCEFVGRVLAEIQERPLYYVREERSSPAIISNADRKNVVTRSLGN
jgi:polyisoprenyl-phosphate glycosyltransferase